MEDIKNIAKTFFERASEDEKDLVNKVFTKLKELGLVRTGSRGFMGLMNMDGKLDFDDVLLIYYLANKAKSSVCCNECCLPVESNFSCLLCLVKSQNTYDLCGTCHRGRKLKHEHQFKYLVDTYSLVKLFIDQRTADADQRSKEKGEMEQLLKIARSHYQAGTPEVKELAQKFFNSMDTDGDKRVNLEEFLTFMGQQGHGQLCNPKLFKELDTDHSGNLDFDEFITLYYIVNSGRPFCDSCNNFISGIYFSCADCFTTRQSSFRMCLDCYAKPKHSHKHDGRSLFLDNYTLLELIEATKVSADDGLSKFLDNSVPADALGANPGKPLETACKAVDIANLAVKIGGIAATSASTAAVLGCSIM